MDLVGSFIFFYFKDTETTEIYTVGNTLSLHDALPIWRQAGAASIDRRLPGPDPGRRAPRSEEHTSELQSLPTNSYAVFCLKKKTRTTTGPTESSRPWTNTRRKEPIYD